MKKKAKKIKPVPILLKIHLKPDPSPILSSSEYQEILQSLPFLSRSKKAQKQLQAKYSLNN